MKKASVFEYTIGKKAEDTTTAILNYLLTECKGEEVALSLRGFFGIPDEEFTVDEQFSMDSGRPDLIVRSDNETYLIVIENKLDAYFTWTNDKHQIERYAEWLYRDPANANFVKKSLFILAPEERTNEIRHLIDENRKLEKVSHLTWQKLCEALNESTDSVAMELLTYINNRYRKIVFTGDEMDSLKDKSNYSAFDKLFSVIRKMAANLADYEITKVKFDDDDNSYGFYLNPINGDYEFWIGLWPEFGGITGKPIVVQNRIIKKPCGKFQEYVGYHGFLHGVVNIDDQPALEKEIKDLIGIPKKRKE